MPHLEQHPSRTLRPEHRWPALLFLLFALTLYVLLPDEILGWVKFVIPITGLLLLLPLVLANPGRMTRNSPGLRFSAVTFSILLMIVNQVALVRVLIVLIDNEGEAKALLLAAVQVWIMNVIGFTTIYWELDRGGPVIRTMYAREKLPELELRFPQDEDDANVNSKDWSPRYVDYLYSALANSMAFSATDAMPITSRFKLLFTLQAFGGFVILTMVIARSVNILN